MQSNMASDRTTSLVSTLHSILKPFLLRRLKVDVEFDLPPKKEYVLYAPLTEKQKSVYEAVLNRSLRQYLIAGSQGQIEKERKDEEERKRKKVSLIGSPLLACTTKKLLGGSIPAGKSDCRGAHSPCSHF